MQFLAYKKSRFSTRLPLGRLYTKAHFWIAQQDDHSYRVGLTKFATRMLGDLVECGLEVEPGTKVKVGQVIGWVECLKAASDLFCMGKGTLIGMNQALEDDPELLHKDPYQRGWLYAFDGSPEPDAVAAEGYAAYLDEVIAKMLGESND